jgi:hypothetical protein
MTSDPSLQRFFARYADAAARDEPEALAAMYAPTFIVGGPQGSSAFSNDARFLEWLRQVRAFNRDHGMTSLAPLSVHGLALSPCHTLATVRWGAQFARTGERIVEFEIAYLLEKNGQDWNILTYISQRDQAEEMEKLGVL